LGTVFLLSQPSDEQIGQFLEEQENVDFSYSEVGATRNVAAPAGYNVDHNRQLLGNGHKAFDRGREAIRAWKMFDIPWVRFSNPDTPIDVGQTVAIVVRHYGFFSLNATRIVYKLDEISRFGFAYGTLSEHGEIGEERFSVEHLPSGEVWYDLHAFSRPGSLLARIGYPLARSLQKRFAADSKAAMLEAVAGLR